MVDSTNESQPIVPANDAPTNSAVTLTASPEDTDVIITLEELVANVVNVDGSDLRVIGLHVTSPLRGMLVDNMDGTWTFTPSLNDESFVEFSYVVANGSGNSVEVSYCSLFLKTALRSLPQKNSCSMSSILTLVTCRV